MRIRTRGYAVLAAVAYLTIACSEGLQAEPPEPAIAAYTAAPSNGSTNAYIPRVLKQNSDWNSHIAVQNTGTGQANVTLSLYASSPTPVHVENAQIPIGASWVISTVEILEIPDGFEGSVVVNSDQPIVATVVSSNGASTTAYNGFSEGSSTLHVLQLFCDGGSGFGLTSMLTVQNVGTQPATVNIAYTNSVNSVINVDPNRSHRIDQETHGDTCVSTPFFTAEMTSDQPISAVVDVRELDFPGAWANEAQTGTSNAIVAPGVFTDHSGWGSRQVVQNTSDSSAAVTIFYEGHEGSPQNLNLDAKQFTVTVAPPGPYRGSMTVSSNQSVAGITEILNFGTLGDQIGSYPVPSTNSQGTRLHVPFGPKGVGLQSGETFESILEIANTGASSTNVTVTYYDSSGNAVEPNPHPSGVQPLAPFSLDAGESTEIDLSSIPSGDLPNGFYSAKIESDGQPLAGAVLLTQRSTDIFSDGFESGDTSTWSSTVQN
jgi:hypothetical protein